MSSEVLPRWAVVLGASSGFGEACPIALAKAGWNVSGVHLDRKATQATADQPGRDVIELALTGIHSGFGERELVVAIGLGAAGVAQFVPSEPSPLETPPKRTGSLSPRRTGWP